MIRRFPPWAVETVWGARISPRLAFGGLEIVLTSAPFDRVLNLTAFDNIPAFEHALRIAVAARCSLDIAHVESDRDQLGREWDAFPGVRSTLQRWGLLDAGAPPSAVREQLGVKVVKHDLSGSSPVHALGPVVADPEVGLVVVGSGLREGLGRIVHPSVAEALARKAKAPTLFIPKGCQGFVNSATGAPTLRNVLLPIDGTVAPDRALELAADLAMLLGQTPVFHLLTVNEAGGRQSDRPVSVGAFDVFRSGPLVATIVSYAEEIDADLIVMGTAGHDSLRDIALGSTTEQVLHAAGRALAAVPA